MKFLKQKSLSKFTPNDQTLFTNHYGRSVMNLRGALRLPKGTTVERPDETGLRTLGGSDGFIRYNTQSQSIEALIAGVWEVVRAPGPSAIRIQTLGPGDDNDTIFGPLLQVPPVPADGDNSYNIIVLVENVFQLPGTNYDILYNHLGSGNAYIEFTSPVPFDKNITIFFGFGD
jgi:hypothetical protein